MAFARRGPNQCAPRRRYDPNIRFHIGGFFGSSF